MNFNSTVWLFLSYSCIPAGKSSHFGRKKGTRFFHFSPSPIFPSTCNCELVFPPFYWFVILLRSRGACCLFTLPTPLPSFYRSVKPSQVLRHTHPLVQLLQLHFVCWLQAKKDALKQNCIVRFFLSFCRHFLIESFSSICLLREIEGFVTKWWSRNFIQCRSKIRLGGTSSRIWIHLKPERNKTIFEMNTILSSCWVLSCLSTPGYLSWVSCLSYLICLNCLSYL